MKSLANATGKSEAEVAGPGTVPTRPFGNTGVSVPMLALGGSQDLMSKQLLLRQAHKMGVTYWDTAHRYERGKSEEAIGKYFSRYPDNRNKSFLVTKTSSSDPQRMSQHLETSLKRLKTSYVDLYFIHQVSSVKDDISHNTKAWVDKAKAKGKIRFFGFSTHSNMEQCLMDAAKMGWIDGIMTTYNYRLMHTDAMKRAVNACAKAGIGLTAMKAQAPFFSSFYADVGKEYDAATKLTEEFMAKGFTAEQAKLKAVWENPNIASICSEMPNMTILQANVAAALDKTELSFQDKELLEQYAWDTSFGYCTGCRDRCESMVNENIPISGIMRCLMYHKGYGKTERARGLFRELPLPSQKTILATDYSKAEKACPQKMPIARLMKKACEELA
jgi:predicted aldo/keto reductase-like oxidoreductase